MELPFEAGVQRHPTSYFAEPSTQLDPELFTGVHLKPDVRDWVLQTTHGFLSEHYANSLLWARVWIAGSGVSYQWSHTQEPGDLDVLLGINYVEFRHSNPQFSGASDMEIARMLNEVFHDELHPEVSPTYFGDGEFDVTFYVNPGVTSAENGINFINPYAAYDLTKDEWTVVPDTQPRPSHNRTWDMTTDSDHSRAMDIVKRYNASSAAVLSAPNDPQRRNSLTALHAALDAAEGLYDEIHSGRRAAFGPAGYGYNDFGNHRWQVGKATGVIQSMRRLKEYYDQIRAEGSFETYGMELPNSDTLVRRAGMYRSAR